jgi:hypothetical protein
MADGCVGNADIRVPALSNANNKTYSTTIVHSSGRILDVLTPT